MMHAHQMQIPTQASVNPMSPTYQQSKRQLALDLCYKLLTDLDNEKVSSSAALLRVTRIASLSGDTKIGERAKRELDGFPRVGASPDATRAAFSKLKTGEKRKFTKEQVEKIVAEHWKDFPAYRQLSLSR